MNKSGSAKNAYTENSNLIVSREGFAEQATAPSSWRAQ